MIFGSSRGEATAIVHAHCAGRKKKGAGEGVFDSEKPQSLRGETLRDVEIEKAALQAGEAGGTEQMGERA